MASSHSASREPMTLLTVFLVLVFGFSLVSRRLERTVLTPPMLFAAAGAATSLLPGAVLDLALDRKVLLLIAELGLVMLLFTDACRIRPALLRAGRGLPIRLLTTGMLLTLVLGAAAAVGVLPGLTWWEAGILAAILAPTDAGLGQVIVTSENVPKDIRQSLSVEAGLNDGLSVPFLLLFIALATAQEGAVAPGAALGRFLVEQLGYGALIGAAIGGGGGWLLGRAHERRTMAAPLAQIGVVALPLFCAIACEASGASMFIAAFVAGIAIQFGFGEADRHSIEFAEDWGQLFNWFVFFLLGTVAAGTLAQLTPAIVLYAVLSLTVVRMLPVALALKGTGLDRTTVLFMGWFGPRGLASIVLGLVYLERETRLAGETTIRLAVVATVLASIFVHGVTALPGTRWYARRVAALSPAALERRDQG